MERIEVNVQTGEITVTPLKPEEIAELQARAAALEVAQEPPKPTLSDIQQQLNELADQVQALASDSSPAP